MASYVESISCHRVVLSKHQFCVTVRILSRRRQGMKTFSELVASRMWNPPVTRSFSSKRAVTWGFDVSFDKPEQTVEQTDYCWFDTHVTSLWCTAIASFWVQENSLFISAMGKYFITDNSLKIPGLLQLLILNNFDDAHVWDVILIACKQSCWNRYIYIYISFMSW